MSNTYAEPVLTLLKLGRPHGEWSDYLGMGIEHDDIPELIRLVQDHELRLMIPPDDLADDKDLPEWYAQLHAWRALGQLKSEQAIPALLGILSQIDEDEDDWLSSDAARVFGSIGIAAIQPLTEYLANEDNPMYARTAAGSSLAEIGQLHPDAREACVRAIANALEKYETNDEGFNGFLIGNLVDLKAVEQLDLMKRAFEAAAVDEMINGDVEDVMIELGLLEKRLTPQRPRPFFPMDSENEIVPALEKKVRVVEKKEKKKRKQEKKSRKKNRK